MPRTASRSLTWSSRTLPSLPSRPASQSESRTSQTRLRSLGRDETKEFAVDSRKLNTALAVPKNNHAVPEKTDVKVVGESTRSEVPETALTALHHIENQIDCVLIIKNSVKYKP
jgi:hypothetical protein